MPAFTKGKKLREGIEVEQTRTIANVRIHVERVIGNIRKKYQMLSTTQPIDYLITKNNTTLLDMMVTVCCALSNLLLYLLIKIHHVKLINQERDLYLFL